MVHLWDVGLMEISNTHSETFILAGFCDFPDLKFIYGKNIVSDILHNLYHIVREISLYDC